MGPPEYCKMSTASAQEDSVGHELHANLKPVPLVRRPTNNGRYDIDKLKALDQKITNRRARPSERPVERDTLDFRQYDNEELATAAEPLAAINTKLRGDLPEPTQGIPDYSSYTTDQCDEALEEFRIFFNSIPPKIGYTAPVVSPDSDLRTLHIQKNKYLRFASIRRGARTCKNRLILGWCFLEGLLCWFGIDVAGATAAMIAKLPEYDELFMNAASQQYQESEATELAIDAESSPMWRIIWNSIKDLCRTVVGALIKRGLSIILPAHVARDLTPYIMGWVGLEDDIRGEPENEFLANLASSVSKRDWAAVMNMATTLTGAPATTNDGGGGGKGDSDRISEVDL